VTYVHYHQYGGVIRSGYVQQIYSLAAWIGVAVELDRLLAEDGMSNIVLGEN
jgi:hypothetical protein